MLVLTVTPHFHPLGAKCHHFHSHSANKFLVTISHIGNARLIVAQCGVSGYLHPHVKSTIGKK